MIRSIVLTGVSALCIMLGANKNKTDLLKIYHDLPQKINVEEPKINKDLRLINALIRNTKIRTDTAMRNLLKCF